MINPIDWAMKHNRVTLLTLAFLLISGTIAYIQIPKESTPDISIPVAYLSMSMDGISPSDAERMIIKPMEQELKSLEGLDRLEGNAYQGGGSIVANFETGVDIDLAIEEMRFKVDDAVSKLPDEVKKPSVKEVNLSLSPVLVIGISGDITERALLTLAKSLQDELEALEEVLEVNLRGSRDEVVELILDPVLIQSYDLPLESVIRTVQKHNQIVPAGSMDTGSGRFAVELPSLLEEPSQISNLPLVVRGEKSVRLKDIAIIRRSFRDYTSHARINGQPSLTLELVKRTGKNVIVTTEKARAIIAEFRKKIPEQIRIDIQQDESKQIKNMLANLQNNIISAIILMVVVLIATLGVRGGLLVSGAIPASFVCGILFLFATGYTVNMVVLFALTLSVGILTDAAVVVTEYADRHIRQGVAKQVAYAESAKRMSLPIVSSTLTTVLAFVPLMFWPGMIGEFMKYLPITMIAVLSSSLMIALIFLPVMGAYFNSIARFLLTIFVGVFFYGIGSKVLGMVLPAVAVEVVTIVMSVIAVLITFILIGRWQRVQIRNDADNTANDIIENESATTKHSVQLSVLGHGYRQLLCTFLRAPLLVLLGAVGVLMGSYMLYFNYGNGVELFPNVEPETINVKVYARGNLAIAEQDAMVREVETKLLALGEQYGDFINIYTASGEIGGRQDAEDIIGMIRLELKDEALRRPAQEIRADITEATKNIGGVVVQVRLPRAGPPINKAVQVQLISNDHEALNDTFYAVRDQIYAIDGLVDFEDSTPKPGIDWVYGLDIRRLEQYNVSPSTVGSVLQMATKGFKVSTMRPNNSDKEIDIIARLPLENRTLAQINSLRVNSSNGLVPLNNFIVRDFRPSSDVITREDGARVMTVAADVRPGVLADDMIQRIKAVIASTLIPATVRVQYKGEEEKQNESQQFLIRAFSVALFMILVVLLVQFNSFWQSFLILSAIIMSTVGVMLGHLIIQKPFSIVMSGIGVIALAGIVVNNNIILIDTFNKIKKTAPTLRDALLDTGSERLRPVLLTSFTTSLGLLPAVMQAKVDFIARDFSLGGASGQWWYQLSASIFYGLIFATILTLVVTPCFLYMTERRRWQGRLGDERETAATPTNSSI